VHDGDGDVGDEQLGEDLVEGLPDKAGRSGRRHTAHRQVRAAAEGLLVVLLGVVRLEVEDFFEEDDGAHAGAREEESSHHLVAQSGRGR
jgi:hypothetical protein